MRYKVSDNSLISERRKFSIFSIIYNGVGIALGISLFFFGGSRFLNMIDRFLASQRGSAKVKLINLELDQSEERDHFYIKFQVLKPELKGKNKVITIDDKWLFEDLSDRFRGRGKGAVLSAELAYLPISRRYTLWRVEKRPVLRKPRVQGLIIFFGIAVLGGAIVFTSVRELRRSYKRMST